MDSRFEQTWQIKRWNEMHWTWPKSRIRNLYERAEILGTTAWDLYFSEAYRGPVEPSHCSGEHAETREEYYKRQKAEDEALRRKQARYRSNRVDTYWKAEIRLQKRQHDIMVREICEYALNHGWDTANLKDLLEPGEQLPWIYEPQQVDLPSIRLEPGLNDT